VLALVEVNARLAYAYFSANEPLTQFNSEESSQKSSLITCIKCVDVGNPLQVLLNQNVPRKWRRSMLDRGLVPNGHISQLCTLNTSVGHMAANDASERIVDGEFLGTGLARHVLVFTLHQKMHAKEWTTDFRVLEYQFLAQVTS
jgi:hypothetical protein